MIIPSFKSIIKSLLPPIILTLIRKIRSFKSHLSPAKSGPVGIPPAWSRPYHAYKTNIIRTAIENQVLKSNEPLPEFYAVGTDERCIEYPWLFAHFPEIAQRVLDAGSILNHDYLLEHSLWKDKVLHILTLAPEGQAFWKKGISYLYSDLRDIPIRDAYYDVIVCLSTLEHVGCDNRLYTGRSEVEEARSTDFTIVISELKRVLKPSGTLLLSVPFGKYRHFGTFQQFDQALLEKAIEAFGQCQHVEQFFYRYTSDGWQSVQAEDCADAEYVEWVAHAGQTGLPDPLPVESDRAAAARAVACVKIIK